MCAATTPVHCSAGCFDLAQEQEERWARHDGLASSIALLTLVAAALRVGAHLSLPDMAMHMLLVRIGACSCCLAAGAEVVSQWRAGPHGCLSL